MPRPELYPVKKVVGFTNSMLTKIDKWRRKQADVPSRSEAIRRLVEQALRNSTDTGQTGTRAKHKAAELASNEIDRLGDRGGTGEERAQRKRRLIKGPREFRDLREDPSKTKK
jgi:ribosomal protein L19E